MKLFLKIFGLLAALNFASCSSNGKSSAQEELPSVPVAVDIPKSEIKLAGTWISKDNSLYHILEFKGKSTVVIKTMFGPFATSYERNEEFIRVQTDKSDLLFEIISEDSIVGSGFADGLWVKE